MTKFIEVGDSVYRNRLGWSGLPMEVLELKTVKTPYGDVSQALCKGAKGWGLNGLLSEKHGVRVSSFAVSNLTHSPNSALWYYSTTRFSCANLNTLYNTYRNK